MKIELETIPCDGGGYYWCVRCGDRYDDMLMAGEALEVVARALFGSGALPYLQTKEQHEARERHNRERLAAAENQAKGTVSL